MKVTGSAVRLAWYVIVTLLAVFAYFYGLDSQHIPKNGDEYPYAHITRLTADSGHLLPLQSQLRGMRNTKPPMLTWQGIASTNWGREWTLWRLRYPSVLYTLLTAAMVFLVAWKLSGRLEAGFIGLLCFLAFFSTYRYGRPFLVNAPEVFWVFFPFFALLYWQPISFSSRFVMPALLGVGTGLGLLYKSFALVVPVALALSWWHLHRRDYRFGVFLAQDSWKVAITATVALAVFGAWFVLDPDPRAIWTEFVLSENMGKISPDGTSYLWKLIWSTDSVGTMVLSYPFNAGALAFPVAALAVVAYKRRHEMDDAEKLLWIWVLVLLVFFCIPSQRSPRNLLPAMPALAILCALNWQRISRKAFLASLAAVGAAIASLAYLSLRLEHELADVRLYPPIYWILLAGTGALVLLATFVPALTRATVSATIILGYLCLAALLRPFDGDLGSYHADIQQYAKGKNLWVPCNFRAKDERYRFIFPGTDVHGYRDDQGRTISELEKKYRRLVVQLPLSESGCPDCKILGGRLDVRGRQSSGDIKDMLQGNVFAHLFVRELFIEAPGVGPGVSANLQEGCR